MTEISHPIHDIPNEILAKVFVSIAQFSLREWYESATSPGVPWTLPFPMVACAVCRHWRDVAQNTPELWSTIYVPIFIAQSTRSALTSYPARCTTQWLDRSKAATLDVFLAIPNLGLALDLSAEVILPKVMGHFHRLRRLVISGDLEGLTFPNVRGLLSVMSAGLAKPGCITQTLDLRFSGTNNPSRLTDDSSLLDRYWDFPADGIPTHPSVRRLHCEGIRISPASFPGLVSLVVSDLTSTVAEFNQLFQALPNLRELSLHRLHVYTHVAGDDTPPPITVPNLSFLSLGFARRPWHSPQSYPAAILKLPNLETLELRGESSVPICSCLNDSFALSINNLQTLRLINFVRFAHDAGSETTVEDIRFLQLFTSVRTLEVIRSPGLGGLLHGPTTSAPRPRRGSLSGRPAIAPSITGISRTLEGLMQQMRTNSRPAELSSSAAAPSPTASQLGTTSTRHNLVPQSTSSKGDGEIKWPNLERISLDCMEAADIVSLCQYVLRNGNIRTVQLSGPARRHLSDTVKRRQTNDTFFATPHGFLGRMDIDTDANGKGVQSQTAGGPDVEAARGWLERRVQLIPFEHDFD